MSRRERVCVVGMVAVLLLLSESAHPACPLPDPDLPPADADRVNLRVPGGCDGLENCVESMECVNDWLADVRDDSSPPVIIDIGAGTFSPFVCNGHGAVTQRTSAITLRGAGRSVTTIENQSSMASAAVSLSYCDGIELQHLRVLSAHTGIGWGGPGDSTYTDIEVDSTAYPWYELDVNWATWDCDWLSEHWSWSSTWIDRPNPPAYIWAASCSKNFFFDSELRGTLSGISSGFDAEFELYGSVLRIEAPSDTTGVSAISAVTNPGGPVPGSDFHMHGGALIVDASAVPGMNAIGVNLVGGSVFDTQGTAFVVKAAGGGLAVRMYEQEPGGTAASPLLLSPSTSPPGGGSGGYVSLDGQDLYVETDCQSNGDCDSVPGGSETHLMVYTANCYTSGPWFDTVTGRCRGVIQ